ncbi:hypothetical protein [uncultured Erythrobacter sp.]|uniref:hypothetical protein n=1 Tax=uncultured Erythrobacter sp. TaxID=263913 RepID=UPI00265936CD|nr:hypothetical protein [uncultured Erythrobacter sp.]
MKLRIRLNALIGLLAIASTVSFLSTAVNAQGLQRVNVGTITSTQSCTYYRNYSGSKLEYSEEYYARVWGAAAAARYYAAHTTWRSWVVKDCQSNFQTMRSAVEAALASSGRLTTGRGGYSLDITISDIGETAPARSLPVDGPNDYSTSWGTASATVSFTLKDAAGRSIDGGVVTKQIEMSRTIDTADLSVRVSEPGESVYDLMQREVAQMIARRIAFKIHPLRVTAIEDDLVELNYGGALLPVGSIVDVSKSRGIGVVRYRVISATGSDAAAQVDGDNDTSDIDLGNLVTFIEDDSDAASARRFRRKRLP